MWSTQQKGGIDSIIQSRAGRVGDFDWSLYVGEMVWWLFAFASSKPLFCLRITFRHGWKMLWNLMIKLSSCINLSVSSSANMDRGGGHTSLTQSDHCATTQAVKCSNLNNQFWFSRQIRTCISFVTWWLPITSVQYWLSNSRQKSTRISVTSNAKEIEQLGGIGVKCSFREVR